MTPLMPALSLKEQIQKFTTIGKINPCCPIFQTLQNETDFQIC